MREHEDSLHPPKQEAEQTQPSVISGQENYVAPTLLQQYKKELITAGIVVAVALIVGFFVFSKDNEPAQTTNEQQQTTQNEPNESEQTTAKLDRIIYAHNDVDRLPRSIFSRPASGGDRKQLDGSIKSTASYLTRDEDAYAFYDPSSNAIWYGEGDEPAKKIYDVNHTFDVTRMQLNKAEKSIAFSVVQGRDSGLTELETRIVEINTEGSDQKIIHSETADNGALFLENWNPKTDQVLFRRSCWNCDGYNADLYLLTGEKEAKIYDAGGFEFTVRSYSALDDLSKIVFIRGKAYSDQEMQDHKIAYPGLGEPSGPPFELVEIDLASGQEKVIKVYGAIQDMAGKDYVPSHTGWTKSGTKTVLYYTYKNQLFMQNESGDFDLVFENDSANITNVYSLDEHEIVVGTEAKEGETIVYFNTDTKKAATIMETSFYTLILAITRK